MMRPRSLLMPSFLGAVALLLVVLTCLLWQRMCSIDQIPRRTAESGKEAGTSAQRERSVNFVETDPPAQLQAVLGELYIPVDRATYAEAAIAFGRVLMTGELQLTFTPAPGGGGTINSAKITGQFTDLFDFAYGTNLQFFDEYLRAGAIIQAGFATHGTATGLPRGRVFFSSCEFSKTYPVNISYP